MSIYFRVTGESKLPIDPGMFNEYVTFRVQGRMDNTRVTRKVRLYQADDVLESLGFGQSGVSTLKATLRVDDQTDDLTTKSVMEYDGDFYKIVSIKKRFGLEKNLIDITLGETIR